MTTIEWTDATWNPVRGCSRVSAGCDNCYAMRVAHRFSGPGLPYQGLTRIGKRGVDWAGKAVLVPEQLDQPLRWKRPRRIFVNSMSDLFHESLPLEHVAAVFGVMAASPRHTFQVLTKRPKRALEFFEWVRGRRGFEEQAGCLHVELCGAMQGQGDWDPNHEHCEELLSNANDWPLRNVWLGVSVEDQRTADERIPLLLQCQAMVRFVSYEPALGPVQFDVLRTGDFDSTNALTGEVSYAGRGSQGGHTTQRYRRGIDWVIVGGESGPGARPFELAWARSTRDQCRAAGVAFFCKQLGARPLVEAARLRHWEWGGAIGREARFEHHPQADGVWRVVLRDRKGGDWSEWPEDLRVREFPEVRT